jgi:TRAP-type C4-dicarboxylate transport system permease small subunit
MADDEAQAPRAALGRILNRLAAWFAVAGGAVLVAITTLVVISILGRSLFARPVPGDFEIVGFGTAVAVFLFLPYCYMQRGNVAIDVFLRHTPARVQRVMDAFAALLFGAVAALFAWRMSLGLMDTFSYGDISMIVGVPLWWAYPIGVASFALLCLGALYTAVYGWGDDADG